MLPKPARLPSTEFKSGGYHTIITPYFSFKAKKNPKKTRIGVVASAVVHKAAAKRNFWKRQTKTILKNLPGIHKDLLIILFPKVNTLTKAQFKKALLVAAAQVDKIK